MICLKVTKDKVETVVADGVHSGEYRANLVSIDFSDEYVGLTKKAVFTKYIKEDREWIKTGNPVEVPIIDNECDIPTEMLKEDGRFTLGIYAYSINEDNTLELRYSPKPKRFTVREGSYIPSAGDEEITPSQLEIYTDAMNKGLIKIDEAVNVFNAKMENGDFTGPQGPAGKDGTVQFDELTEEQKNSLVDYKQIDESIDAKIGDKQELVNLLSEKEIEASMNESVVSLLIKALNSKEDAHVHNWIEESRVKKSEENLCGVVTEKCSVCGETRTVDDIEHDFFVEQSGYGRVPDMLKCRDCDYRTEDPNFVSKPVTPPMPDDCEHTDTTTTYAKKSQENLCRVKTVTCNECDEVISTENIVEHDFFVEQEGNGKVADILKCRNCDYRMEDPNFVPTTPVFSDFPDDEEE